MYGTSAGKFCMGPVSQLVTILTADPGVASSLRLILKYFYGHIPTAESRRVCVFYKQNYVHKVLVDA